ncbi:MAG TPA: hypothetical protein VKG79_03330 [Bryobacteraceae bacterium]|nr:hypothetical protein [Bryobacteraceae bacterium]
MSLRDQLHAYIAQLEQRLRWSTWLRGLAILTGGALVATLVLVTIANARAFSNGSVTAARFGLILILALAAAAGLALPLRRLTRRRAVQTAESAFPQFQQRLTTFTERDGQDPFIELLAQDTLGVAQFAEPKQLVTDRRLWISLGTTVGSLAILIWMIAAGPGFLGYGASLLWTGPHRDKPALYDLRVAPGDAVVRRHADQIVSAIPTGLKSPSVKLHARFQSSPKWEEIAMQPQAAGSFAGGYQFLFAGLLENVEYYVTAGAVTSKHYSIHVTDLPAVKQIRVTYHYPGWTGLPSEIEERGGDLRAVTGTEAALDVTTDRPLEGGQIQLDNGQRIQLTGGQNNLYHGTVKMDRDGVYHVAGVEQGQTVRVSEDFFIEARKANPPQISLVRPRGDFHVNPIEEVTIAAKATDDYGLKNVELHYSVNGGPETTVDLLSKKNEKQSDGSTTISLENFKLVPGDVVSVYATAKDANAEAQTDMIFVEADPFERNFSQSQVAGGGGGGGGGGGEQTPQISQREKEIISATFKQHADKNSTKQQAADIAKLLSQSQATLRDQAITLSGRLQARELTDEVKAISDFQKDMMAAATAMSPAAQQLHEEKWKDAIPNEQKALQFLLRAEATFREIQVAFGAQGGGGGGGGAARDLAALSDLELDTEKNQYETQKTAPTSAEQREKQIEDALKKLDELAKREEDLAQQQRNSPQTAEQRWQQEMLQREAEQLQREMEQQLSQNGQRGQQSQPGQSGGLGQNGGKAGGSSSTSSGARGQSSGQDSGNSNSGQSADQSAGQAAASRQQAAQHALDRLRQANEDMRRAASQNASAADSRRAADRLREATDLLGGLEQQDAAGRINSMAQTADQLAAQQKKQADHVRDLVSQLSSAQAAGKPPAYPSREDVDKMVNDRQKVSDDLTHLTQQMRDAARQLAPTQPGASTKLRGALQAMDENDLGTRLQRSSDWLRTGNFSDPLESSLTSDLQKLGQQVRDAARALGTGGDRTSKDAALSRAMDDLSRLRDQLSGLGGRTNSQPGQGQAGRGGQPGQSGQPGQQPGQGGQAGQAGQPGGNQAGGVGDRLAGPVGNPGGGATNRDRQAYGGWDTGNTRISGHPVTPRPAPNPADTQREIDQGLNLLNQVRAALQDNPEAQRELQSLIEQMRNLDPSRFPGNPALVEQMHQQLISEVDTLELQLRRAADENHGGTIRNPDPAKIPAGYQESVAEYYRKLSGGH